MPEDNGHAGSESQAKFVPVDVVTLTYDRVKDHLEIGGAFNSIDLALDMLARATRALEGQLSAQRAMNLRAQLADQARTQAIVDKVRGGG